MNKVFYAIITVLTCTSCAQSFSIQGSSNVSDLDGRMLYLKAIKNGELKNIDSCEVIHGQFKFNGTIDSTKLANIYMDDESVMPVVLEKGEISIQLNNTKQSCTGTALNDKLFKFIEKYNTLMSRRNELVHIESQGYMNGDDMDAVYKKITAEAEKIAVDEDKLITGFICDNFDNCLGPGVFMLITSAYQYPELTPWIEDIMSKATEYFKNDAYVKNYMDAAQRNQNIMNGMETPAIQPQTPLTSAPTEVPADSEVPPTPAQMAQPQE